MAAASKHSINNDIVIYAVQQVCRVFSGSFSWTTVDTATGIVNIPLNRSLDMFIGGLLFYFSYLLSQRNFADTYGIRQQTGKQNTRPRAYL